MFLEPEPVGAELLKVESEPKFFTWSRSRGKMVRLRNTDMKTYFLKFFICLSFSLIKVFHEGLPFWPGGPGGGGAPLDHPVPVTVGITSYKSYFQEGEESIRPWYNTPMDTDERTG